MSHFWAQPQSLGLNRPHSRPGQLEACRLESLGPVTRARKMCNIFPGDQTPGKMSLLQAWDLVAQDYRRQASVGALTAPTEALTAGQGQQRKY